MPREDPVKIDHGNGESGSTSASGVSGDGQFPQIDANQLADDMQREILALAFLAAGSEVSIIGIEDGCNAFARRFEAVVGYADQHRLFVRLVASPQFDCSASTCRLAGLSDQIANRASGVSLVAEDGWE